MKVRNGFARVFAVVEDEAESGVGDAFASGDFGGDKEEVAKNRLIFRSGETDAWDRLAWDDEDVDRSLGRDVAEGQAEIILEDNFGRDFAVTDFLEECFIGHVCFMTKEIDLTRFCNDKSHVENRAGLIKR